MQYFHANGLAMPRKTDARQVVENPSPYSRNLFDTCSGVVWEVFDCCSGTTRRTPEQHPKDYRSCPEPVPKRTRSASEGHPNSTRRNTRFVHRIVGNLKAAIERCPSDLTMTQAQPKNDLRITQETAKDDLSLTQPRPSLRTGYREESPKDDTTNTQETANNDTRNARLMYRECTVSVRGLYRKGTREVLKRYWRATKHILNACTSGVDQRYSKGRRGVEALKNIRILCLGFLCFMLFNLSTAWAQSAESRTAEGQTEIKPLKIGDTIPTELWLMPLQVVNHPNGKDTITLNDYRDKKLIILDFWATWCIPCMTSLAKTDEYIHSLAEVAFLPIGYEDKAKLKPLIEKEKWKHLSAHSNIVAKEYFPYRTLPHVVWIRDGKVIAITGSLELEEENIRKVLTESEVDFQLKIEQVDFDSGKPLLFDENGGGMDLLEEGSLITSAVAIMSGGVRYQDGFLLMYNRNIKQLYQEAFSSEISYPDIYARTLVDLPQELEEIVNETRRKANNRGDSVPHLYCYNLITGRDHSKADMKARMLVDLNNFFGKKYGIHASVVKRKLPVLKLVKISREPKHAEAIESLASSGLNPLNMKGRPLSFLVKRLQHANYNLGKPIMLGSNLPSTTDLALYGRLNDFDMVKNQLRYHGFDFVDTEEEIDVLLITNKK